MVGGDHWGWALQATTRHSTLMRRSTSGQLRPCASTARTALMAPSTASALISISCA